MRMKHRGGTVNRFTTFLAVLVGTALGATVPALAGAQNAPRASMRADSARAAVSADSARAQLRHLQTLHRELERAMRRFNERQVMLSRSNTDANRELLSSARMELEVARAQLNRELQSLLARESVVMAWQIDEGDPTWQAGKGIGADRFVFFQPSQPRGWLGINFSTSWRTSVDSSGKSVWSFAAYPVIESVEPGSPAERAGLVAGDVLVSMAGRDVVRGSAPFSELLQPGAVLPIEVRRGSQLRRVTARITARPVTSFNITSGQGGHQTVTVTTTPTVVGGRQVEPSRVIVRSGTVMHRDSARLRAARVEPSGSSTVRLVPVPAAGSSSLVLVAGAELFAFRGDFQPALGVREGLLVLRVAPATPMSRAGVRPGDVILAVNRATTRTPEAFRLALENEPSRSALLDMVRGGERRSVTLRW